MTTNRNSGLDILRSIAIILVFMSHYTLLTHQDLFGPLGHMGGIGVDLFFALSGYLIGHQIFKQLNTQSFSLTIFYVRRFLRTFPNYFFVLGLYLLLPFFRENSLTIPVWQFITFTLNFNFIPSAFSHAWSLCIEEQFYLILPLIALFLFKKNSRHLGWVIILMILIGEIIIRTLLWLISLRHAGDNIGHLYMTLIYAPTYSRLDSLILGVSLALLKNYKTKLWENITRYSHFFLIMGIIGYCAVTYIFQTGSTKQFFLPVLNWSLLGLSSAALTISALSRNSLLNYFRIPGAMNLAIWSYAIYLTHKPLIHVTKIVLSSWHLENSEFIMLTSTILVTLIGGYLLYIGIEQPFLKLRDRIGKREIEATASAS